MKTLFSLILAIVLGPIFAVGAANINVQVDSTTHALGGTLKFFSANSNLMLKTVGDSLGAANVIIVSSRGDDTLAKANPINKVFKTLGEALSNAVDNCVIQIMPDAYPLTPAYINPTALATINSPMVLRGRQNVTISAYGARILGPGQFNYFAIVGCKNITVAGLTFDCTAMDPATRGAALDQYYTGALQLFGVNENITIRDCTFNNASDQAITTSRKAYGLTVDNCRFFNIGSTNVQFLKLAQPMTGAPWIDGTPVSGFGTRSVIRNCFVDRSYRGFEWDEASTDTETHSGIQVIGNTCSNLMDWGFIVYSPQNTLTTSHCRDIIVADNIFHYAQDGTGIDTHIFNGIAAPPLNPLRVSAAIVIQGGKHGVIRNNILYGWHDDFIQFASASCIDDWVVDGNIIQGTEIVTLPTMGLTNAGCRGIRIASSGNNPANPWQIKNITITRNQIRDIGGNALYLSGANVLVEGNHIWNVGRASASQYRYFVEGQTLNTSNIVFRNNFSGDDYRVGAGTQLNGGVGVTAANGGETSPKRIIWGRNNVTLNINQNSLATVPFEVGANSHKQVYIEGKQLTGTLGAGGSLLFTYPFVKANSYIKATCQVGSATRANIGALYCKTITADTSFVIESSNSSDNSQILVTIDSPDIY